MFSRTLRAAIEDLKLNDGSEVAILDGNGNMVHATDTELLAQIDRKTHFASDRELTIVSVGEQYLAATTLPLIDATGTNVGEMISVNDYTDSIRAQNAFDWISTAVLAAIMLLSLLGLNVYLRRGFAPLATVITALEGLSRGDLDIEIVVQDRRDEVGDIAKAFNVFHKTTVEARELAEQQAALQAKRNQHAKTIESLTKDFGDSVIEKLEAITLASTDMRNSSQRMTILAEQASARAGAVAQASQETSGNVQTAATASEELAASIHEISDQV